MKILLSFAIAALLPAAALAAEKVRDTSYIADGARVLRHEVVVATTPAEAFAAFATKEGWRAWATPFVEMKPRVGVDDVIESSYNPDAAVGQDTNIKQQVLAYVPDRMFAFRTTQAPKGFPHPEEFRRVFSVVEFEPLAKKRTRVRLSMIGYGTGPGFDGLYNFFAKGNAWAMGKLAERFEKGPIDWKQALSKQVH